MEDTEQRGPRIENGSEWSNGTVHFDRTCKKEVLLERLTALFETFPVGTKPSHSVLDRNSQKFWLNGSHPESLILLPPGVSERPWERG